MIQQEEKKHRRAVLKQGIVVAGIGAVATLQATAGTAHANGTETATIFSDTFDPVVTVRNTSTDGSNVTIGGNPHGIISTAGNHGVGVLGHGGTDTNGVAGTSTTAGGVVGISTSGVGTAGICTSGDGVNGKSDSGNGVVGISSSKAGVLGQTTSGDAILALARPLASTDHPIALHVQGTIKVEVDGNGRDNPVGTATLALAASSVTVTNPVTTPNSIVLLTPQSDPGATVWVTTTTGSFTIHRAMSFFPIHPAVTFNYLIIN